MYEDNCRQCQNYIQLRIDRWMSDGVCVMLPSPQKHFDCINHRRCDNFIGWWYDDVVSFISKNEGVSMKEIKDHFWRLKEEMEFTLDSLIRTKRIKVIDNKYYRG